MKAIIFPAIIYLMCFCACCDEEVNQAELTDFCIKALTPLEQDSSAYSVYLLNKAKWDCHNIKHYSFVQVTKYELCFGTEHRIEVLDNEIKSIELIKSTEFIDTVSVLCDFLTIDYYFKRIEDATDETKIIPGSEVFTGDPLYVAQKVEVSYDAKYGYPLKGIIDYHFGIADDEFPFELKDLQVLD